MDQECAIRPTENTHTWAGLSVRLFGPDGRGPPSQNAQSTTAMIVMPMAG